MRRVTVLSAATLAILAVVGGLVVSQFLTPYPTLAVHLAPDHLATRLTPALVRPAERSEPN
jgi:hypothetical protein